MSDIKTCTCISTPQQNINEAGASFAWKIRVVLKPPGLHVPKIFQYCVAMNSTMVYLSLVRFIFLSTQITIA